MKKTRKSKKKRSHTRPLSPGKEAALRALLESLPEEEPGTVVQKIADPEVAEAFILRLPPADPAVPTLLEPLYYAFPQKGVRKALKKLRFRLERRGITLPALPVRENSGVLAPRPAAEKPWAKLGPPDGAGSRALFIALPRQVQGFDVGFGVVSDEQGFIFFSTATLSKKQMREVEQAFSQRFAPLVDVAPEHAAAALERAYTSHPEDRPEQKQNYLVLRPRLLETADPARHPGPESLSAADGPLTESRLDMLFAQPLMKSWLLGPPVQTLRRELEKIQESPLHLTDVQKQERSEACKSQWIQEHYTEARVETLRVRFEEMARFLDASGEADHASLAARCAQELAGARDTAQVSPVLLYLVGRSLELSHSEAEASPAPWQEDEASGLILPR